MLLKRGFETVVVAAGCEEVGVVCLDLSSSASRDSFAIICGSMECSLSGASASDSVSEDSSSL